MTKPLFDGDLTVIDFVAYSDGTIIDVFSVAGIDALEREQEAELEAEYEYSMEEQIAAHDRWLMEDEYDYQMYVMQEQAAYDDYWR